MNMVKLIDIKCMYRMELTDDEKEIQEHILEFQKQVKLTDIILTLTQHF